MDLDDLIRTTTVEPRPYQTSIITRILNAFTEQNLRSVLVESPTGSGKTVMGLLASRLLQERLGLKVGWVAMRRNLLTQAAAENRNRRIDVQAEFISMFDKEPPANLDLLVVDEAQHDAASSMAHLHSVIQPRYILGLSATPFRADKVKLCFDTVIKEAGIHRLIQDGYLSQFHHYTIGNYSPAAVARLYCQERHRWGKSIMYFHKLAQCRDAQGFLAQQDIRAEVVTGSSDRERQIDEFRDGKIDVLLNCMVLAEGFDCPELQTVFCRPSGRGVTVQMCGRVLRKHPEVTRKQIVQCQKTRWPFIRTAKAIQQYVRVDDEWRSLELNPKINQVTGTVLSTLARTPTKLPNYLQRHAASLDRLRQLRERNET